MVDVGSIMRLLASDEVICEKKRKNIARVWDVLTYMVEILYGDNNESDPQVQLSNFRVTRNQTSQVQLSTVTILVFDQN